MTSDGKPLVDYERAADQYRRGRELTALQVEQWRRAVSTRLPEGPLGLVIDAGAGTGAFLAMWRHLGATRVLAVEPSVAMRSLAACRAEPGVEIVDGTLAQIPAPAGSADVVWVSAMLHHVPDLLTAFQPGFRSWVDVLGTESCL